MLLNIILLFVGIAILLYFAELLVKSVVQLSLITRLSVFFISLLFVGFDPENLAVGLTSASQKMYGITIGSILGALMVSIALAFGITILLTNIKFEYVSPLLALAPILSSLIFYILVYDGLLSRIDGVILLTTFGILIYLIYKKSYKSSKDIVIEEIKDNKDVLMRKLHNKGNVFRVVALFIFSLVGVYIGSEVVVHTSKSILSFFHIGETFYGMIVLALLISIEELARELPAALKGRVDMSYGNVVGSILHFLLFNSGLIALFYPIQIPKEVIRFYMPVTIITITVLTLTIYKLKKAPKWLGVLLLALYLLFTLGVKI